jgi:uncharacterized protein YbaR (Trm112 family)/SAM-dependent methyltransferase
MRHRLLEFLGCPMCGGEVLELDVFRQNGDEVMEGVLRCTSCGRQYPIIVGVPRMLPDALIGSVHRYHPEFFSTYRVPVPVESDDGAIARTLAFFTRQRPELFSVQMQPAFADYIRRNLELRIPDVASFAGCIGLDAGCGEGRYAQCVAGYGAEVIGMDLGNSVDYAYRRNKDTPLVHIVQGSIFQPPIKDGTLDFVISVGVLHHLPNPRRGFESLVPLLHEGGTIHIWVYGLEGMSFVYRMSHLTPLRGFTSRLPPAATYFLSVPIALALELGVFIPVRLVARTALDGNRIDPQLEEVAKLPLSVKVAEVHDRIGAPVTYFLSGEDLRDWYERVGLEDIHVTKTVGGRGWTATGIRTGVSP